MSILDKLNSRISQSHSLVCVGLDADMAKLPASYLKEKSPQFAFNRDIIDATAEFACAFKPNTAFYESQGAKGWEALAQTMAYLKSAAPDVFTILDAKRADIGNTSAQYATAFYDELGADAVTLHPYLGAEAIKPFLTRPDKAPIVLCHTSNAGAGEFQELRVDMDGESLPLWRAVARRVGRDWNTLKNCMLVVGATVPDVLLGVREEVGDMPLLVPGIGAQGGDLKAVLDAGLTADKRGLVINSSRGIIFNENPANAARTLREQILSKAEV
jgi:orotidine-5'-phosphate decarboxylase